jgi:hypothetical protein
MTQVHADQFALYKLFHAILDSKCSCHDAVLAPWLHEHVSERDWLCSVAACCQVQWRPGHEALWRLYAASRVNELLLLRFQADPGASDEWCGPDISLPEYLAFMTALGMHVVERPRFHPFFHEIVDVEPAAHADAPVEVIETRWPCLLLGELMFSRGGVVVRAGRNRIDPKIAVHSTLYWAYRRAHRPTRDLSHGWGHNSQWRTAFRRDGFAGSQLHFNIDGRRDPHEPDVAGGPEDPELTVNERIELLTHRSFVLTAKPHDDLWPFEDRLTITDES